MRYADLVTRYGKDMAYDLLLTFEKVARIKSEIDVTMDEETRFHMALHRIETSNPPPAPERKIAAHE